MLLPDEQPWLIASQTWRQTQKILNRSSSTINRRHPSTVYESMIIDANEAHWSAECIDSPPNLLQLRGFAELAWTPPLQRESGETSRTLRTSGTRASWAKHGEASKIKDLWGQGKNVLRECVQEQARIGKAALEGMLLTTPVCFSITCLSLDIFCHLCRVLLVTLLSILRHLFHISVLVFELRFPSSETFNARCALFLASLFTSFGIGICLDKSVSSRYLLIELPYPWTLFFMRVLRDFLDVCWCIVTVLRVSGLEWMVSSCYYVSAVSVFVHVLCCKFFAEYLVLERLFPGFSKFCVVCPTLTCQLHQVLSCFWCDMRCVLASP